MKNINSEKFMSSKRVFLRLISVSLLITINANVIAAPDEKLNMPEIEIRGTLPNERPTHFSERLDRRDDPENYVEQNKAPLEQAPITHEEKIAIDRKKLATENLRREYEEITKEKNTGYIDAIEFIIEDLIDKLEVFGSMSWVYDLFKPDTLGRDPFDYARNDTEYAVIQKVLKLEAEERFNLIKESPEAYDENMKFLFQDQDAKDIRNVHYRDPSSEEYAQFTDKQKRQYKLEKSLIKYVSTRDERMGYIFEETIRRQRKGSIFPLSSEIESRLYNVAKRYVPANMCKTDNKPGCQLFDGTRRGTQCACPPFLNSISQEWRSGLAITVRSGRFCKTIKYKCELPRKAPKGTECYCADKYSLSLGKVVSQ